MTRDTLLIDLASSAGRIARDIDELSTAPYTSEPDAICRYAYIDEYRRTLDYLRSQLEAIGFDVQLDPVGNLVARNVAPGQSTFGLGSHCDSNRRGGKYDGTLGVVAALEVCRLNAELGLALPLTVIAFLEEEASGFGHGLLGSRVMTGQITEQELREDMRALDDGRPFWEHATDAGLQPANWRESNHALDAMIGWIELHIEQGRVLQDAGRRVGVVHTIAGIITGDITAHGRADHAGGTPMDGRLDPSVVGGEVVVSMERLARAAGAGTVGTVGELELRPGIVGVIPEFARASVDVRSINEATLDGIVRDLVARAQAVGSERGVAVEYTQRLRRPPTPMSNALVAELEAAASDVEEPYLRMHSGAAHDTMLLAPLIPSAMVFVPCKDGISHSPVESAEPADASAAVAIILNALAAMRARDRW
jgi:allantoate deiminase